MNADKKENGNGLIQMDLIDAFGDYDHIVDLDQTFDADQEVIDDNLTQGMKLAYNGKPLEQVHQE